jgi:hypothetical protein
MKANSLKASFSLNDGLLRGVAPILEQVMAD